MEKFYTIKQIIKMQIPGFKTYLGIYKHVQNGDLEVVNTAPESRYKRFIVSETALQNCLNKLKIK